MALKLAKIFLLGLALCSLISVYTTSSVEEVFELISDGLANQPSHSSGRAVLLVGLTGSGKTTLAKFITDYNTNLVSVEVPSFADVDVTSPDDCGEFDYDCQVVEPIKDYYIEDLVDNAIGTNATVSQTFYPEIYIDQENGEVVLDCPGFADTRSESHEVAIAVFMKNIFTWAKETKIIIVVGHSDVLLDNGNRFASFLELLKFVTKFLKNYNIFEGNVGMVVTKVRNEYTNVGMLASDPQMIFQIAQNMISVKAALKPHQVAEDRLLADLLVNIGTNYPKIAIFRKPYTEGPLKSIQAIMANLPKIRRMLFTNTGYAKASETDIDLTVSLKAEMLVIKMCLELKNTIHSLMNSLEDSFRGYYMEEIKKARSYEELRDFLHQQRRLFDLSEMNDNNDHAVQVEWFFQHLLLNKINLGIGTEATYEAIVTQIRYLKFLQALSDNDQIAPNPFWADVIPEMVQHLYGLSDWYSFIVAAFERLAQSDVQLRKNTLSFDLLSNWKPFKSFVFDELKLSNGWSSVGNKGNLQEMEQKSLNDILHAVLDPPTARPIDNGTGNCDMVVEGFFIKLSEVEPLMAVCQSRKLSKVYLFAQYAVFVDTSLHMDGSEVLMGVVAPKWEVVGQQAISLNGRSIPTPAYGVSGAGVAGLPGGQAGTFYGIGYDFVAGDSLSVFTNGGAASDGQNGANGRDGHGDIEGWYLKDNFVCKIDNFRNMYNRYYFYNGLEYVGTFRKDNVNGFFGDTHHYIAEVKIKNGLSAQPGFDGGRQGLGGWNGLSTDIVALGDATAPGPKISNSKGQSGRPGKGGKGGIGAVIEGKIVYNAKIIHQLIGGDKFRCDVSSTVPGFRAPSATNGLDNFSGAILDPVLTEQQTYVIVSKYRSFLFEKTTDRSLINAKSTHKSFVKLVNRNKKILANLYDLIYEFIALEELNRKRNGIPEISSIYDMLLHIIEQSADQERVNKPDTFVIVANYLAAAILTRKLNVDNNFGDNLVIDVSRFVAGVRDQIDKFVVLDHQFRIDGLRNVYTTDIVRKQTEGNAYISEQFELEMGKINKKINDAVDGLLAETSVIAQQLESERDRYMEYVEKARRNTWLRVVFGALKVTGQFLSLLGPKGVLLDGINKIVENVGKKYTSVPSNEIKIPEAIDAFNKLKQDLNQDYQRQTVALLAHINGVQSSNPVILAALGEVEAKVKGLIGDKKPLAEINQQFPTIIDGLKTKYHINEHSVLDQLARSFKLAYAGMADTYYHIAALVAEQPAAQNTLSQLDGSINKVHAYENFVDASLRSYLDRLTELMAEIVAGSTDASVIALEISRYEIQTTLNEVKTMINTFTAEFDANEELIACIESLENLMTTTINVYNQLQTYNDHIGLANLLANINKAVSMSGIQTNDAALNTAIQQLDYVLVSNAIRSHYKRAVNAFQQLVFPFAPLFLSDIQISEQEIGAGSNDQMMRLMISKLEILQKKINAQQASIIEGYDDQLFTGAFDDKTPFFVWNVDQHAQAVKELLQGKEVTLKANVLQSVANAVKFNKIELRLVTTGDQAKMDSLLSRFHMRLTHLGNSRYKCGDKFYILSNKPQIIEYSFAVDAQGVPKTMNEAYKKLRDGDILLSPYALWKFQVVAPFKTSFELLSQFHGTTKLLLTGRGQYVKQSNPICKQPLDKYYQVDEVTTRLFRSQKNGNIPRYI